MAWAAGDRRVPLHSEPAGDCDVGWRRQSGEGDRALRVGAPLPQSWMRGVDFIVKPEPGMTTAEATDDVTALMGTRRRLRSTAKNNSRS